MAFIWKPHLTEEIWVRISHDNTRLQYCNRARSSGSVRRCATWIRYANPPSSLHIRRTDLSLTLSFSDGRRTLRFWDRNTCWRSRSWFSLGRPVVPFRWHKTDPVRWNFSTIARIVLLLGALLLVMFSSMAHARSILTSTPYDWKPNQPEIKVTNRVCGKAKVTKISALLRFS